MAATQDGDGFSVVDDSYYEDECWGEEGVLQKGVEKGGVWKRRGVETRGVRKGGWGRGGPRMIVLQAGISPRSSRIIPLLNLVLLC